MCLDIWRELERRSAALLMTVAEARGLAGRDEAARIDLPPALPPTALPDLSKLLGVARMAVIFSAAFLLFIYLPDMPGGPQALLLATIFGAVASTRPMSPVWPVSVAGAIVIAAARFIHFILMPMASGFAELAVIIFVYVFICAALLNRPAHSGLRFIALGQASAVFAITNDQQYDFITVANLFLDFQIPFLLIWLTASFPVPFRPEHAFQRELRRYMSAFRRLTAELQHDRRARRRGWWAAQVRACHLRNLLRIPDRLDGWIDVMPKAAMSAGGRAAAHAMSHALFDVAGRMVEFNRLAGAGYGPETVERLRPKPRRRPKPCRRGFTPTWRGCAPTRARR